MRKWIWTGICILWAVGLALYFHFNAWGVTEDGEYTVHNDFCYAGDDLLVIGNHDGTGFLYRIGQSEKVQALFSSREFAAQTSAEQVLYDNGNIYLLISSVTQKDDKDVTVYMLVALDDKLNAKWVYRWFDLYESGTVTEMTSDETYIYLTQVLEDGSAARIYGIRKAEFTLVNRFDDQSIRNVTQLMYSDYEEAPQNFRIVYASYQDRKVTTIINGEGIVLDQLYDEKAHHLFENKKLSISQLLYINWKLLMRCMIFLVIGETVLITMAIHLKNKKRVIYLILAWEVMLWLIYALSIQIVIHARDTQRDEQYQVFTLYTLDDSIKRLEDIREEYEATKETTYYKYDDYLKLVERLQRITVSYGNGKIYKNVCIVDLNNEWVVASAADYDNCSLTKEYGNLVDEMLLKLHRSGTEETTEVELDGKDLMMVASGSKEIARPNFAVMAVLDGDQINAVGYSGIFQMIVLGAVMFAVASVIGIAFLLIQSAELQKVRDSMDELSRGETSLQRPRCLGEDINSLWNGLLDLDRNMQKLTYSKYLMYEAYYRFAPKLIEQILHKDSITEVKNGDGVRCSGTVARITGQTGMALQAVRAGQESGTDSPAGYTLQKALELAADYQQQKKGILLSASCELSDVRMLFPENTRDPEQFGIAFQKILQENMPGQHNATIFMHYSEYVYGVSGAKDQSMPFLYSEELYRIEPHLKLLEEMELKLVVTGQVMERMLEAPAARYIGYILPESMEKIALYEVLDADEDEQFRAKKESMTLFEEAIRKYENGEIYEAQGDFAKVLRSNPYDSVARWYVFDCGRLLKKDTGSERMIGTAFNHQ